MQIRPKKSVQWVSIANYGIPRFLALVGTHTALHIIEVLPYGRTVDKPQHNVVWSCDVSCMGLNPVIACLKAMIVNRCTQEKQLEIFQSLSTSQTVVRTAKLLGGTAKNKHSFLEMYGDRDAIIRLEMGHMPWMEKRVRETHSTEALYRLTPKCHHLVRELSKTDQRQKLGTILQKIGGSKILKLYPVGDHPACLVQNFLDVRRLGCDILLALQFLHKHGWVHRGLQLQRVIRDGGIYVLTGLDDAARIRQEDGTADTEDTLLQRVAAQVPFDNTMPMRYRPFFDLNLFVRSVLCDAVSLAEKHNYIIITGR